MTKSHRAPVLARRALMASTALVAASLAFASPALAQDYEIDGGAEEIVDGEGVGSTQASPWTVTDILRVGDTGEGRLIIRNGGEVSSDDAEVGSEVGSFGAVTVTGPNSVWTIADFMDIGFSGDGELTISDGGSVSSGYNAIAFVSGSTGAVTVTGANSTWTSSGYMDIGANGNATLTITDGGTVSNVHGQMGDTEGRGETTVTGAGSAWVNSETLTVGRWADGVLTIADGGLVSAASAVLASQAGSTGVLNIGAAAGDAAQAAGAFDVSTLDIGAGAGTLNFRHTGDEADGYVFGADVTGQGQLLVQAGHTTLTGATAFGQMILGDATLRVGDGGSLSLASTSYINSGGSPVLLLDGAPSVGDWTLEAANLNFNGGNGSLVIQNGATARMGNIYTAGSELISITDGYLEVVGIIDLAGLVGAGSTMLISGADSEVNASNVRLGLGTRRGVLTLADGGLLTTSQSFMIASGLLNIGAAAGDAATAAGRLDAPSITFSGGDQGIVFNHTGDFVLDAKIQGAAGLMTLLSGHTTLSGDNTYTGETTLAGGTLTLASDTALGGSTLRMTGSVLDFADGVDSAAPVIIDSDTSQFQVLTGSATQSGVISEANGPRPFEKIGAGELVLTADNTWTGETTVSAGTLTFDGGSLDLVRNLVVSADGGSLARIVARGGAQISTNDLLFVGDTSDGELLIEDGAAVRSGTGFVGGRAGVTGTATITGGGSWDVGGRLSVGEQGDGALTISEGATVISNHGRIGSGSGATGTVLVEGSGSLWTLLEPNIALDIGLIGSGALTIANDGRVVVGSVALSDFGVSDGVLNIGAAEGSAAVGAGVLDAGAVIFGAGDGSIVFNHTEFSYDFAADISGAGTVRVLSGATTLSGDNSYTGETVLDDGALTLASDTALGGSTLRLNGGNIIYAGGVNITNPVIMESDSSFQVQTGSATQSGVISEAGGSRDFYKSADGELILTADNTWTGQTYVGFGTLTFDGGSLAQGGDMTVSHGGPDTARVVARNGAQIAAGDTLTVGDLNDGEMLIQSGSEVAVGVGVEIASGINSDGALIIGAASGQAAVEAGVLEAPRVTFGAGAGRLVFNHTDLDFEFGADISGAGAVSVLSGHTILSGDNSYTGETILDDATLTLGSDTALGGSTLRMTGSVIDYADGVDNAQPIIIDSDTSQFQVLTGSATQSGVISEANGSRPFEKTGDGELVLTADNTWTGETRVSGGTLTFDGGSLSLTEGLRVYADGAAGVRLRATNGAQIAMDQSLRVEGTATATAELLVEGGADVVLDSFAEFGAGAGGSGSLTVTGAGSSLRADSNLAIGRFGDGALLIADGAEVSSGTATVAGGASGSGTATVTGGASWTAQGVLTIGQSGQGVLTVSQGGTIASGEAAIGNGLTSTGTTTIDGQGSQWTVSDPDLSLYIGRVGSGALTLSNGGLFQVATVNISSNAPSSGVLNIGASAGDEAVAAGVMDADDIIFGLGDGSIVFNHTDLDYEFSADISGAGAVSVLSGHTILSGDNSYTGETILDDATLTLASDTALGGSTLRMTGSVIDYADGVDNAQPIIIDSNTSQFQVLTGSATQSGVVSEANGPRPFEKIGDGELVLTADNTWTGGTRVSGGTLTFDGGSLDLVGRLTASANGAAQALIVARNGAQISTGNALIIGEVDSGEMLIETGADITVAGAVSIGDVGGSSGLLTIRGGGASLSTTNILYVGTSGAGEMLVEGGGQVFSQNTIVGGVGAAEGRAFLTGAGSEWINNGLVELGREVRGEVVVADGARFQTGVIRLGLANSALGVLTVGDGGAAGVVDIGDGFVRGNAGAATVRFNHTDQDYIFTSDGTDAGRANVIIDRAAVEHVGTGSTTLVGAHAYTGATTISAGTLRVDGSLTNEGGLTVQNGGALAGAGSMGGVATVQDGGTLIGEAGSVLGFGSLSLSAGSILDVTLDAPDADALFAVTDDLVLDGTLNITDAGDFGAGIYGLMTYGGDLQNNGLDIGDMPIGYTSDRLQVQTSVAGQVNLVNAGLADLVFWDGGDPLNADNDAIDGGDGTWTLTGETWTDADGATNGAMTPMPGLAVFTGEAGTVTLDDGAGALSVTGLQFAADGYVLTGDDLRLVEGTPGDGVSIRVGNGAAAGADWTATIDADLTTDHTLFKTDLGELVLTGDNVVSGRAVVRAGTLSLAEGSLLELGSDLIVADTGSATATVTGAGSRLTSINDIIVGRTGTGALNILDGGVLNHSGTLEAGIVAGSSGVVTVSGEDSLLTLTDALFLADAGEGSLTISDGGVVDVGGWVRTSSTNTSTSTTTVTGSGSRLEAAIISIGMSGTADLVVADDGVVYVNFGVGAIRVGQNAGSTGTISIGAQAGQAAAAAGDIQAGTVQFGDGAGEVVFNHTETDYTFAPQITGLGDVLHLAGVTTLTGANDYTGITRVNGGTLVIAGDTNNDRALYFVGDQEGQTATLVLAPGVTVDSGTATIASAADSTGIVTVDGATWTALSNMVVGETGEGELTVQNGGVINTEQFLVGGFENSSGVATLDGAGTTLNASLSTIVGYFGNGEMRVSNGAAVNVSAAAVGGQGDGLLVLESGATWTSTDFFSVGLIDAVGTVQIQSGADLISGESVLGSSVNSQGSVTVSDAGSTWTADDLLLGDEGLGLLTVQSDGLITADTVRVGGDGLGGVRLIAGGTLTANSLTVAEGAGSQALIAIGAEGDDAAAAAGVLDVDALTFGDGDGYLVFNHTDADYVFRTLIQGEGAIEHHAGTTTLTADNTGFDGVTQVLGGSLLIDGAIGAVDVADGGSLGGTGTIGSAAIVDGGTLLGVSGQTLTLGSLVLSDASNVDVILGAPSSDSLFDVTGDLTLDGVLNVTDAGGFGAGVYRLFDYGGALTDNTLEIGAAPAAFGSDDLSVQTAVDGQVNLVSVFGQTLSFWDGAGPADDGAIQGGEGVWSLSGRSWTSQDGSVNGVYDNPGFAVFQGTAGTVTVSGDDIGVTGMQFAVDGYAVEGDAIALTEAETLVRVGDGTAAGADMTATIASVLTGVGTLVKMDLGTLILTGTNSYAGGVQVRDGVLIGDTSSLVGDIDNDATLVFDQGADADFAGAISGEGETIKRSDGVLTLTGASSVDWSVEAGELLAQADAFSGDVGVASGATLTLNADADTTFSGVLSGEGVFAKTGAGGLALTGNSSDFDGLTEVRQGLVVVNGVMGGAFTVMDGAMLAGSGSLVELTAEDGAVIAPGNSIGTLNVAGDVVFEAGSIYEVEVDPASDVSDRIVAGGTATLNGGVVRHIGLGGDYGPESTYVILTAEGGVTGTFEDIETDFAFLDASLDYEANTVLMLLERNAIPFPAVGETFNQRSTGAAIEATQAGDPLYDAVVGQNANAARLAFDMLSGEAHGSIRTAQSEAAQVLAGTLARRMDAAQTPETGAVFWAQATGAHNRLTTDGNAASLTHRSGGLMMGADAGFDGVRIGLAAGASDHDYDSAARGSSAEGTSMSLAAYGSGQWGAIALKGVVSGTWHEVETDRVASFPGFTEALAAEYDAETIHAFVEASWRVDMGGATTLEPFVNLARVRTETDAFTETGGDAALSVQGRVQAANLATAGVGLSRDWDQGDGRTATLAGRLGWRHAWDDTAGDGRHAFAGSPGAFTVEGLPIAEDALMAELGLDLDLQDRMSLSVDWAGQYGSGLNANALRAAFNWRF